METPKRHQHTALTAKAAPEADDPRLPALRPRAAAPARRAARRVWVWALGFSLALGAAFGLYLQPWASGPLAVAVETVTLAPATRVLAVNGRIAALHSVDVRALVGGRLTDVLVAEGASVARDAELVRVDAATQQAMVRQAVASLDAAIVARAQAMATFAREEALGSNVARTALETAARAVESAEQEVARTTALVDQARVQLENHIIRAPMTGTVLALNVEPGQSIDPQTVLMTIADLARLIVETDVDEAYATQIRAGLPAVLQLAGETVLRDGQVARVAQRVDAATGGLAVDLTFDQPVRAPVGLTVTINIVVDSLDAAITVPRAAIQTTGAGAAVLVVVNGIAQSRPVAVTDWPAARLVVTDGLAPGDVLILDASGITEGQAVRGTGP